MKKFNKMGVVALSNEELLSVNGGWVSSIDICSEFDAAAYSFGENLRKALGNALMLVGAGRLLRLL